MAAKRWPQLTTARLMAIIAALAFVLAAVSLIRRSRSIVESLESPVAVRGWSEAGLHLAGGRTLQLPGFKGLPATSPALAEATRRGVEVAADGRIYGLVRVHHWCGNDPVREHIARVDLALCLEYLGAGQTTVPPVPGLNVAPPPAGRFSPHGWEYGEYLGFRSWCNLVRETRGTAGTPDRALQGTRPAATHSDQSMVSVGGPIR